MLRSERQQPDGAADFDRGRGVAIGRRIIAELAVGVPAPALEERAGRHVRARVVVSDRQQPDGAADADRGRCGAIGRRAVAELAVVLPPPHLRSALAITYAHVWKAPIASSPTAPPTSIVVGAYRVVVVLSPSWP